MHRKKHILLAAILITSSMILSACSGASNANHINSNVDENINANIANALKNNDVCYKAFQNAKHSQKEVDKKDANANNANANNANANNENNANTSSENTSKDLSKNLQKAAQSWKNVAIQCNTRFAQGVVFSAQNTWKLGNLSQSAESSTNAIKNANQMESNVYKKLYDFANSTSNLYWNHNPLAKAALAQDKLAFVLQTLAARDFDNVSLRQSDVTATIANTLMHFSSKGKDLRQKVYDIDYKSLESGVAKDAFSAKDLPIVAIAYMDCARGELDALNHAIFPTNKDGNVNNSALNSNTNQEFMEILANIVISHIISAYAYGYPSDVSAIFKQ